MPKPCWAVVELQIEPLPPGSGIVFSSAIKEKVLPYRYQNHVKTSVEDTFRQGIYGWEVTDAKVTLTDGEHHHVHTHPLDFFVATPVAALRALKESDAVRDFQPGSGSPPSGCLGLSCDIPFSDIREGELCEIGRAHV